MAVQFSFGENTRVLPDDKDIMKEKFVTFLSEDADIENFRDNIDIALATARRNETEKELQEELSKVLKETLEDNESSLKIYESDGEAFAEYLRGDTDENKKFANENSLYEIFTDNDKYLEMIGASYLKYGRDLNKLPDYDIDSFLKREGLDKVYSEQSLIDITLLLGEYTSAMQTLLEAFKDNPTEVLKQPDFINNLTFRFKIERFSENPDLYLEIPPQPLGAESMAEQLRTDYVNYIRKELGIRSGGFIPEGQYYTSGVESKVEYKPYSKRTIRVNVAKEVKESLNLEKVMKNIEANLYTPNNFEMTIMTKNIFNEILKSDYIKRLEEKLESIKEINLLELQLNILTPKVKKKDWSQGSEEEKQKALLSPFANLQVNVELREAKIGKFDFSYYSKAGEIKKDRMNDHLNEVRTKVKYLRNFGVDGGI